jgi:TonB family protein
MWIAALLFAGDAVVERPHLLPTPHSNCAVYYYPWSAVTAKIQGNVTVSVVVAADGNVKSVTLLQSSGSDLLDNATIRCVTNEWHFKPGTTNGVPTEMTAEMRSVYKLR